MYLKYIEIQGFKSFARKIKFDFHGGITGIVGPNGSGKSNVADAVRWVLGEQKSRQLRGSKMEDVIFAGTANRKPQGFASVSIIFDNSDHKLKIDFEEVTISRRLFRSGESEYLINGSACRLRDINELFYDTGIGRDGYSIIGQGQIDRILQGKSEERRELFDEAAGIVKYKKKKSAALRKLESEQQNLVRINDILGELSKRVGPLKRQSEAALKFVDLRSELKKYDINLFLCETEDLRKKIADLSEKEDIVKGDLEESSDIFEESKVGYNKLNDDLLRLDREINSIREEKTSSDIEKENLLGQISVIREQINSLDESDKLRSKRVISLTDSINNLSGQLKENNEELTLNKEKINNSDELTLNQDKVVLDIQNKSEEIRLKIEEMKERLVSFAGEKGEILSRLERLNATYEQAKARKAELNENLEKFGSQKEAEEEKVKQLEDDLKAVDSEIFSINAEIIKKEKEASDLNSEITGLNKSAEEASRALVEASSRLDSLKALCEQYEGYSSSIKEIMKLKDKNQGILGVVADLIKVEKKYETAIETALGGNIQNIVTDSESTAKETIEYLKKNKLGRATFLPLAAVKGRGELKNPEVLKENGVLGTAGSLVNFDKKYAGVVSFLLGRILVCDNINNALKLARKYNYSLIIVTLEGEQLNRGGSISGGAFKRRANFLGRHREIEELEVKVSENRKLKEELEEKLSLSVRNRESLSSYISQKKDELREKTIFLNTIRINFEQAKEKASESSEDFLKADEERKNIDEQAETFEHLKKELEEALALNEDKNETLKKEITEEEDKLSEYRAKEASELILAQELKVEHSRLIEHGRSLTENVIRLENEIEATNLELEKINKGLPLEEEIKIKNEEIERISKSISDIEINNQKLGERLALLESEKEKQSGSHRDVIDKREEYSARISDLDKELYRLTSAREKLEEKLEEGASRIWLEYELTYISAKDERDETLTDIAGMRERTDELRAKIKRLGSINVDAIDEYKEVSGRYEFLKNQHDDLIKARGDLEKIVSDLDKEMRFRFNDEFKKISKEFEKVFKEMFGGGTGRCELEEDVDVLDAGIRIIAQPPGKKLQNMMQLSGGEKALTAIAVLFAIQNLKPSPFCILDEIEAALDDSNIGRFASYLKKLSSDIQFIVITHRKGTMEACDRLYGITMQEKGVSTLVSVDLADAEIAAQEKNDRKRA